jgi:hypothetical protein
MDDVTKNEIESILITSGVDSEGRTIFMRMVESLHPVKREEVVSTLILSPRLVGVIWNAAQGKAAIARGDDNDFDGFVKRELESFDGVIRQINDPWG